MDAFEKRLLQKLPFGERLAQARIHLHLSQEALAEAIGTTARSISRWEHNQAVPQQYYRERLCRSFLIIEMQSFIVSRKGCIANNISLTRSYASQLSKNGV